jgi:hypothetical protein
MARGWRDRAGERAHDRTDPQRRRGPSTAPSAIDPFDVLGLPHGAGADDIAAARRRLAKDAHPDAGGSVERMQRINDAAEAALARIAGTNQRSAPTPRRSAPPAPAGPGVRRDHPSFTIEALPVEAFEALLIVGTWLGELIDDEPPYAMEWALTDPIGGWCRLDLVPDAGASTVSIAVAGAPGGSVPAVDLVRDAFVDGLNRLDWSSLDPSG